MKLQFFLGANTPEGFHSRAHMLFCDSRISEVWILKGGAGCGKSTLMRTLEDAAAALGCNTEELLCSSDPSSLDGLLLPAAGIALVDGTAPHVVEPPLCGCGAQYINLGQFYDREVLLPHREELFACKRENGACYTAATRYLYAAAAVNAALSGLSGATEEALKRVRHALSPQLPPAPQPGTVRELYLSALTPDGAIICHETLFALCSRLTLLQDNYGLGAPLLATLLQEAVLAGKTVLAGYSPLSPQQLSCVLLPEEQLGWALYDRLFPLPEKGCCLLDLDALAQARHSARDAECARFLLDTRQELVRRSLACLSRAKEIHDRLEALYAPAVDFAGVNALTAQLLSRLRQTLGR